jgi:hypothetical protein
MQPREYVNNVLVTESNNFDVIGSRFTVSKTDTSASNPKSDELASVDKANLQSIRNIRLLHAAIGICTEVGELFEFLDKDVLDLTNLKEEVGDAFWYCGIAVDELNLDFDAMVKMGRAHVAAANDLSHEVKRVKFSKVLACATKESSVLLDLLKKSAFYGKPLDEVKFAETLSNFVGSMMVALSLGGFTVEEAMEVNIAKLRKRYGDKFSETAAITRNLDAERKILEGGLSN